MKTRIFLMVALIATVCITACSDQQVVVKKTGGQEISFRLQGGMPETATRALATTIKNLEAFVVYGTDDVLAATNDLLFEEVTVARIFGTNDFTYAPKVYYSENATNAGFFAFAPVSADVNNTNLTALLSGASFDYTVPAPDRTGDASQEDLLVALTAPVTPSVTPVPLEFEHALARIFITAVNETPDPIIIKSLKLLNLATTGTFNIAPPPSFAWGWVPDMSTAITSEYEYILPQSGVAVPATAVKYYVTSEEQGMLILPQTATNAAPFDAYDPDDFALEVTYDLANLKDQPKHIVIYDDTALPTPKEWEFEMGKQYRINITFTGTAIEFDVTVHTFDAEIDVTTM